MFVENPKKSQKPVEINDLRIQAIQGCGGIPRIQRAAESRWLAAERWERGELAPYQPVEELPFNAHKRKRRLECGSDKSR